MEANSSTSNFRRFALRVFVPVVAALALLCFAADLLVTQFVVFKNESAGAYKIHRLYTEFDAEEVPIFGSSRAAGSYVPELLADNCFNYGIEKTQYRLTRILLEEELAKGKSTPIVINFDYEFFRDWFGNPAHFIPNLEHDSIAAYVGDRGRAFYHLPGLRYFGVYDDYYKAWMAERSTRHHLSKGGFFLDDTPDSAAFAQMVAQRKATAGGWEAPEKQLQDWVDLLAAAERPIFVVVAPYHSSYFEKFSDWRGAQEYLNAMDQAPNVHVLDFGKEDYPDDHFMNTSHLNYRGAQKFSTAVGEAMRGILNE